MIDRGRRHKTGHEDVGEHFLTDVLISFIIKLSTVQEIVSVKTNRGKMDRKAVTESFLVGNMFRLGLLKYIFL